jgi:hypothetical protein
MAKVPSSVQYIRDVFEVTDIDKVWNELERRFKDLQEVFLEYGKMNIEPLLNIILKRHRHPTWINLVTYVLKEKIERRKKMDEFYKARYTEQ